MRGTLHHIHKTHILFGHFYNKKNLSRCIGALVLLEESIFCEKGPGEKLLMKLNYKGGTFTHLQWGKDEKFFQLEFPSKSLTCPFMW